MLRAAEGCRRGALAECEALNRPLSFVPMEARLGREGSPRLGLFFSTKFMNWEKKYAAIGI